MKIDLIFRNVQKGERATLGRIVETLAGRHLKVVDEAFGNAPRRLHATIERQRGQWRVTLRLHLPPRKTLVAQERGDDFEATAREAMQELAKQADRHRRHLRGLEQWKRKARRQRLHELKAKGLWPPAAPESSGGETAEQEAPSATPLMERLESSIRHELAWLRANGDLPADYPTVADLRDELWLFLESDEAPRGDDDERFAAAIARLYELLDKEIARTREQEETVSLEAPPERDAQDDAEAMVEEEIGEFYQPDEALHVEDLIPAADLETPEQLAEDEAQAVGLQLLGRLPQRWRRATVLHLREGLDPQRVAAIMDAAVEQVERQIEWARRFIEDHFAERGLPLPDLSRLLRGKRR